MGLEVLISPVIGLAKDGAALVWRKFRKPDPAEVNALLVGRIPYDRIVTIDWEGDEYYGSPHIYCRFLGWRPSPYEELVLCQEHIRGYPHPHSWYTDIVAYPMARKMTKRYEPSYYA